MRKLLVATIVSMICHAAALVWVVRDGEAHARAQRRDVESQTDPPTVVEPIAVVLLEPRGEPLKESREDLRSSCVVPS